MHEILGHATHSSEARKLETSKVVASSMAAEESKAVGASMAAGESESCRGKNVKNVS